MLKRFTIYVCTGLLMVSCYTFNKPKKPKHLISKSEMVNILIDLKLVISANGVNKKILENHGIYSEDYIYKKHNIDSLQFALSNNYYAYYVEDYDGIYAKVKDSLEALSKIYKELEAKELIEKRIKDSLNLIIKKDSISNFKIRDSIKALNRKDSVRGFKLKPKFKKGLIKPVSEKDFQPQ